MIQEKKIQVGYSLYDYSNIFYGGFDNILTLVQLNPDFVNMDVNLSPLATQPIVYDDKYYTDKTLQVQINPGTPESNIGQIIGLSVQNLYDVSLMVYSGFDNLVKMLIDSNINSANDQDSAFKTFTFDKSLNNNVTLNTIIAKKGYVFSTYIAPQVGPISNFAKVFEDLMLFEFQDSVQYEFEG